MTHRVRFHPRAGADIDAVADWVLDRAGPGAAARRQAEIEATIASLAALPHRGSLRDEVRPGLRAIPAGRRAVVTFTVDDDRREVLILTVTSGGANWATRARLRT